MPLFSVCNRCMSPIFKDVRDDSALDVRNGTSLAIHRQPTITTHVEMNDKITKITEGQHECVKEEVGYGEGWWIHHE
jgi:hypothetical protein